MKRLAGVVLVLSAVWPSAATAGRGLGMSVPELLPQAYSHLRAIETVADQGLCEEWVATAVSAGWSVDQLDTLLYIIYRESRCRPDACSTPDRPDLRRCRDWGLTQINDYSWKRTIRGFGLSMEYMMDPYWNLWMARWLYDYSVGSTGCGWTPWNIRCPKHGGV